MTPMNLVDRTVGAVATRAKGGVRRVRVGGHSCEMQSVHHEGKKTLAPATRLQF
jgi:hypothetical protein